MSLNVRISKYDLAHIIDIHSKFYAFTVDHPQSFKKHLL